MWDDNAVFGNFVVGMTGVINDVVSFMHRGHLHTHSGSDSAPGPGMAMKLDTLLWQV